MSLLHVVPLSPHFLSSLSAMSLKKHIRCPRKYHGMAKIPNSCASGWKCSPSPAVQLVVVFTGSDFLENMWCWCWAICSVFTFRASARNVWRCSVTFHAQGTPNVTPRRGVTFNEFIFVESYFLVLQMLRRTLSDHSDMCFTRFQQLCISKNTHCVDPQSERCAETQTSTEMKKKS